MTEVSPPRVTPSQSLPSRWREVLRTSNPPQGELDAVSRWLVLTRASVLPMTLTAGLVAGLLAVNARGFNAGWLLLALAGILLAHASNNLMNDLFDSDTGLDTASYPRTLYAPHPIQSGMITRQGLLGAALAVNLVDLAILLALFSARGWPVIAFALGGFFLSAAYTAPPLRLKKRGLGEPTVLAVWGPLMVGGTYYAAVGHLPGHVVAASVPYGLLCTTVLFGKHIDKIPWDAPMGIRTLPVILGEAAARRVSQGLMAAFYVSVVALVVACRLVWVELSPTAGAAVVHSPSPSQHNGRQLPLHLVAHRRQLRSHHPQGASRDPLRLAHQAEQDVLAAHVVVAQPERLCLGHAQHRLGARREAELASSRSPLRQGKRRFLFLSRLLLACRLLDGLLDQGVDGDAQLVEVHLQRLEDGDAQVARLAQHAQEEVLGSYPGVASPHGLVAGQRERTPQPARKGPATGEGRPSPAAGGLGHGGDPPHRLLQALLAHGRDRHVGLAHGVGQVVGQIDVDLGHGREPSDWWGYIGVI